MFGFWYRRNSGWRKKSGALAVIARLPLLDKSGFTERKGCILLPGLVAKKLFIVPDAFEEGFGTRGVDGISGSKDELFKEEATGKVGAGEFGEELGLGLDRELSLVGHLVIKAGELEVDEISVETRLEALSLEEQIDKFLIRSWFLVADVHESGLGDFNEGVGLVIGGSPLEDGGSSFEFAG